MRYKIEDGGELAEDIVHALTEFRGEDYVDTPLYEEDIDVDAIERLVSRAPETLKVTFVYKDTRVTIEGGEELDLEVASAAVTA